MIYLDNNGTTAVAPGVLEAMLPYLQHHYGNPSTRSPLGQQARRGLDLARKQVAEFLGCESDEVVFTSGATESNNWVLQATAAGWQGQGLPHFITSQVEHPSVGRTLDFLEQQGRAEVTRLAVDCWGRINPEDVLAALRPNTVLVSLMHSNNEVGTLQPVSEVARALEGRVLLHTDAAQSCGKVPIDLTGVDFLSLAGHKMYAPKGVGALYLRRGTSLGPLLFGAGHEGGRRSSTENVAYAVALGAACQAVRSEDGVRMAALRDQLQALLQEALGQRVLVNGHPELRLPNTLSVNFVGTTGAEVTAACPQVVASTGPACHDGVVRLSHVLAAMGVDPEVGKGAVRLTLSRETHQSEVLEAGRQLVAAYQRLTAITRG